jgi:hypothetical protein
MDRRHGLWRPLPRLGSCVTWQHWHWKRWGLLVFQCASIALAAFILLGGSSLVLAAVIVAGVIGLSLLLRPLRDRLNTMSESRKNKLAVTSLVLGLVGWSIYILQWCFDLTVGIFLAAFTAGVSAVFSTILDLIPFVLWMAGIVTGHAALTQMKRSGVTGKSQAIWGLLLSYLGLFFSIIIGVILIMLIFAGVGVGLFDKIIPFFQK